MRGTARQIHEVTTLEVAVVSVDMRGVLDDAETLTGTPTITPPTGSGLVFTNKTVNSATIEVNGVSLAAGQAVQFKADATAGVVARYELDIVCGTSAGQTRHGRITLDVIEA